MKITTVRRFLVLLAIASVAWAAPALAVEEEHDTDPNACMGPTDPFCPWPPGSGSGDWPPDYVAQCYTCELKAYDNTDLAGTAYYACVLVDPLVQNGYSNCYDGTASRYCEFSTSFCQVA